MDFMTQLPELAQNLEDGKLLLYPTETIWGIGCDATNELAIQKINFLKNRSEDKSFILLVDDLPMLSHYIPYIPPKARNLIAYHSRPLTIIYENTKNLPLSLLAEDGSIAIRVTLDPFCKALLNAFGKPIVSTSANISGQPFPSCFQDINPLIKKGVDCIAQHRLDEKSDATPSVIVKVVDDEDLIFIRK